MPIPRDKRDDEKTEHFIPVNNNPAGRHTGDCVYRAMAFFFGWSWLTLFWDLSCHCAETGLVQTWNEGFRSYLDRQGYKMNQGPRRENGKKYTIGEFVEECAKPGHRYLVVSSNHMTFILDKVIYDTWDPSKRVVSYYWESAGESIEKKPLYEEVKMKRAAGGR